MIPASPSQARLVSLAFASAVALCWVLAPVTYLWPSLKVAWAALLAIPVLPALAAGRLGLDRTAVSRLATILAAGAALTAAALLSAWSNASDPGLMWWHIMRYAGAPCLLACLAVAMLWRPGPFPHRRACDLLLGLCALQIPVYLLQKHVLFPEGTAENIWDQWSGTFPRNQDSSMALVANLTLVYCLHLRRAGAFAATRLRLAAVAGCVWLVLDQHSEINRVILAFLAAAAVLAEVRRRCGPRWTLILAGAATVAAAGVSAVLLVEIADQVAYYVGWADQRGWWRYLEGVQNDRPGGLVYLLRADHPALGFGPGVISYPFAAGELDTVGQTRGVPFAPYLELGWGGVLGMYALILAHVGRPRTWASWCLVGAILLMSLVHEMTPNLTLMLALHVFAAAFARPVEADPEPA